MHAEGERYVETVSGWGEGVKQLVQVVTMVGQGGQDGVFRSS